MAIEDTILELNDALQVAKTAITAAGGTVGDTGLAGLATEIATIPSGGGVDPNQKNVVRFIDYDGTVVKQMTLDEARALTSLPEIPTHDGLTGVKWTHSLAAIQSATHSLDVGAVYRNAVNPDQTIFFMLPRVNEVVTLNFSQSVTNGVTIDWGDGSATETVAGEGNVTATHTYTTVDTPNTPLKLTFTPGSGVTTAFGHGTTTKNMFNNGSNGYHTVVGAILGNSEISGYAFQSCKALSSVVIPDFVTSIGQSAFRYCSLLPSVVIPDSVTSIAAYAFYISTAITSVVIPDSVMSIGQYAFASLYSLSSVVIPDSVTSIATYAFTYCYSLTSVVISNSVTKLDTNVFSFCNSLHSVTIPDSVTSVAYSSFKNCDSLSSIKFADRTTMPTTPSTTGWVSSIAALYILDCSEFTQVPTVTAGFLANIPAYIRILVPASLEADWKAAANWSTYASQIVGV